MTSPPPPRKEKIPLKAGSGQARGVSVEHRLSRQIPYFSPQFKARLRLLFSFRGRINRKQFILAYLLKLVLMIIIGGLIAIVDGTSFEVYLMSPVLLSFFVIAWLNISLLSRRLKDAGVTPWILLLVLVPYFNVLFGPLLVLFCVIFPSGRGPNKYGDTPYDIF